MTTDPDTVPKRGRPHGHSGAAERDEAVLALLLAHGPQTRNQLAERMDEKTSLVWLSLNRLRNDGRIRTCAGGLRTEIIWSAEVGSPCP